MSTDSDTANPSAWYMYWLLLAPPLLQITKLPNLLPCVTRAHAEWNWFKRSVRKTAVFTPNCNLLHIQIHIAFSIQLVFPIVKVWNFPLNTIVVS